MYFPDLSTYCYLYQTEVPGVKNIGWLDDLHDFPKGEVSNSVVEKLNQLLCQNYDVNKMRGTHGCAFCGQSRVFLDCPARPKLLGMSEIWIPDGEDNIIYAAPSLIFHYIVEHQYMPPQPFLTALMKFELLPDWNGEKLIDQVLKDVLK